MAKKITYQIDIDRGSTRGADAVRDTERSVESLDRELREATRSARSLDGALASTNSSALGGGLGAVERFSRGLGVGAGADVAGLLGDIMDVREALPDLSKGFGGLLTSIGPAAIGIGALSLAVGVLSQRAEEAARSAQEYVTYVTESATAEVRYQQLLRDGGLARLETERQTQADQLDVLTAAAEEQRRIMAETAADGITRVTAFGAELQFLRNSNAILYDTAKAELARINDEVAQLEPAVFALNEVLNSSEARAAAAADGFKRLTAVLEAGRDAVTDIGGVVTGVLDTVSDMAQETAEEVAEAFAKLQQTTQATVDKLNSERGALTAALQATVAALNAGIVEAEKNAAEDIAAARADAAAASLKAEQEYQRDALRAETQHRLSLTRLQEDAQTTIEDAIRSGNFAEARAAQEGRDRDKKRLEEDYALAAEARREDFEARRDAEQAALTATIADIERQRDAEKEAIRQRMVAEQAAYAAAVAEIDRLKQAHLDQINAVAEANRRRYAEEEQAIKSVADQWKAMTYYYGGQLHTTPPPGLGGGTTQGIAPLPMPDPFGMGGFFGAQSTGTPPLSGPVINTAGMFNGAVFGAPSLQDMTAAIAFAQQQIAQAITMVFQVAKGAA